MAAEIAEGTFPHYEDEYVEFEADIDGELQLFRVDAGVFEAFEHASSAIGRQRMIELFHTHAGRFLNAAERKFATLGRTDEPIEIGPGDLRG